MSQYIVETNKNSYVTFDPISLRDVIINRLNQGQVFTDQNYQGSNLSALIDIISYTFSTLLFYLNKTSSESMFSEAQIYENMNRIVKLLNYKPIGRLTQNVGFGLTASGNLLAGNYAIPRYSYVTIGGTNYSINQDVSFTKNVDEEEVITSLSNNYLIYQGAFEEYPTYVAAGIENEVIYLTLPDNTQIDHFNIFVYVKPQNAAKWERWNIVSDLFLTKSNDKVYETRFNENKRYEVLFGDGINGKKLNESDQVAIYYLHINPTAGPLGSNALDNAVVVPFNSLRFNEILDDTLESFGAYLSPQQMGFIRFSNPYPSTEYVPEENVDSLRKNAPQKFRSQFRLVTVQDYEAYFRTNFGSFIADVKVVDNDSYLNNHLKYLYNIGLKNPQTQNQILYNQIKFANSCNFNNLYVYSVPQSENQLYLSPPQKEIILDRIQEVKTITSQIVNMDPVYMNLAFYVQAPNQKPTIADIEASKLLVTKELTTRRSDSSIISEVASVIRNNFNRKVSRLGQKIDLYQLAADILQIDGVNSIQTYRSDYQVYNNGITLLIWNNTYPDQDVETYSQNIQFENFKYPIFYDINNLEEYIQINTQQPSIKAVEF
jgi:hypothetical protein